VPHELTRVVNAYCLKLVPRLLFYFNPLEPELFRVVLPVFNWDYPRHLGVVVFNYQRLGIPFS
jgi:hypothetical protein